METMDGDGLDNPILLSALQHAVYCLRQAALIHIERLWEENRFTAEGHIVHLATDELGTSPVPPRVDWRLPQQYNWNSQHRCRHRDCWRARRARSRAKWHHRRTVQRGGLCGRGSWQ